jgi:hypothetical protein
LDTTDIYAEVDLAMKAKALGEARFQTTRAGTGEKSQDSWRSCAHCVGRAGEQGAIMLRP